jgi:hypothetical protein
VRIWVWKVALRLARCQYDDFQHTAGLEPDFDYLLGKLCMALQAWITNDKAILRAVNIDRKREND